MPKKHLICIVGPTAVGKTAVGITLASAFETEIVSADSRQFYKELEIGTAKPSLNELSEAPHHFINSLSIHDAYDVGKYEQEAMAKLEVLFQNNDAVILVGGSGLFVNAVCVGLDDLPDVKPNVRAELNAELKMGGLDRLNEELKSADPEYYEIVDLKNPQRVIRALEVSGGSGNGSDTNGPDAFVCVGLSGTIGTDPVYAAFQGNGTMATAPVSGYTVTTVATFNV